MTNIDHRTTWVQAQQLLLQNPKFINNPDLLGMVYRIGYNDQCEIVLILCILFRSYG